MLINEKRRAFLNFLRGTAIFLMLWGHCIQYCSNGRFDFFENTAFKAVYSFHMPLFMLISGYLFWPSLQKRDLHTLIRHKIDTLLLPIICATIVLYYFTTGICHVVSAASESRGLKNVLDPLINGGWISSLGSLWFLWSVLAASVIVAILEKKVRSPRAKVPLLFLSTAGLLICPNSMLNIFMYPYFLLGFYFGKHEKQLLRTLRAAEIGSLALFPILFLFYEKKHFIYTTGIIGTAYGLAEYILIDSFRWVIGLAGSLFAICICRLVVSLCDRFSPGKVFSSGIQLLGRKSLQVYILSTGLVSYYLSKLIRCLSDQGMSFNMPMLVYDCVFTLLLAAFYAIVLLLINKVLEKTGLSKILFGR